MRTLLASSGSTLGRGSRTQTHAFRRPTKSGPPEAHAPTIHYYTLFDEREAPAPTQCAVAFGRTMFGRLSPPEGLCQRDSYLRVTLAIAFTWCAQNCIKTSSWWRKRPLKCARVPLCAPYELGVCRG